MTAGVVTISNLNWAVLLLYLVPVAALLLKFAVSIANVLRISRSAESTLDLIDLKRLAQLQNQQGISRPVTLKYGAEALSPLSFGLLQPTIILPHQAKTWHRDVIDDVLIHELSHIKRLDWLTMSVAYVIASVIWINPLAWFALRKLSEEAENSCDGTVLILMQDEASYVETLLSIANEIKQNDNPRIFAQMMLGETTLSMRITEYWRIIWHVPPLTDYLQFL